MRTVVVNMLNYYDKYLDVFKCSFTSEEVFWINKSPDKIEECVDEVAKFTDRMYLDKKKFRLIVLFDLSVFKYSMSEEHAESYLKLFTYLVNKKLVTPLIIKAYPVESCELVYINPSHIDIVDIEKSLSEDIAEEEEEANYGDEEQTNITCSYKMNSSGGIIISSEQSDEQNDVEKNQFSDITKEIDEKILLPFYSYDGKNEEVYINLEKNATGLEAWFNNNREHEVVKDNISSMYINRTEIKRNGAEEAKEKYDRLNIFLYTFALCAGYVKESIEPTETSAYINKNTINLLDMVETQKMLEETRRRWVSYSEAMKPNSNNVNAKLRDAAKAKIEELSKGIVTYLKNGNPGNANDSTESINMSGNNYQEGFELFQKKYTETRDKLAKYKFNNKDCAANNGENEKIIEICNESTDRLFEIIKDVESYENDRKEKVEKTVKEYNRVKNKLDVIKGGKNSEEKTKKRLLSLIISSIITVFSMWLPYAYVRLLTDSGYKNVLVWITVAVSFGVFVGMYALSYIVCDYISARRIAKLERRCNELNKIIHDIEEKIKKEVIKIYGVPEVYVIDNDYEDPKNKPDNSVYENITGVYLLSDILCRIRQNTEQQIENVIYIESRAEKLKKEFQRLAQIIETIERNVLDVAPDKITNDKSMTDTASDTEGTEWLWTKSCYDSQKYFIAEPNTLIEKFRGTKSGKGKDGT